MAKRGRQSAASLSVAPSLIETRRIAPPDSLTEREQGVWIDTAGSMPAHWFRPMHKPILASYCRHVAKSEKLASMVSQLISEPFDLAELDKLLAMAERETRAMTACARAMRITHQAQIQPRGAGSATANQPKGLAPWEDR